MFFYSSDMESSFIALYNLLTHCFPKCISSDFFPTDGFLWEIVLCIHLIFFYFFLFIQPQINAVNHANRCIKAHLTSSIMCLE